MTTDIRIIPFQDALAPLFHEINAEWIETMFTMEPHDRAVLNDPKTHIIDPGGSILFAEVLGRGVVGAGALMPDAFGGVELTKMGVLSGARGIKVGEFLLCALIERARAMRPNPFYLLTNKRCASAVHLYEKLGFVHDPAIMQRYGATYERCDVAMSYDFARRD